MIFMKDESWSKRKKTYFKTLKARDFLKKTSPQNRQPRQYPIATDNSYSSAMSKSFF